MDSEPGTETLSLTTGGITLIGVLVSVGVTVGFGIAAAWWVRVLAGLATTLLLIVLARTFTAAGQGPLARLAEWVIGSRGRDR